MMQWYAKVQRLEVVNGSKEFWQFCWDSSNEVWWWSKLVELYLNETKMRHLELNEPFWETFVSTNCKWFEPEFLWNCSPYTNFNRKKCKFFLLEAHSSSLNFQNEIFPNEPEQGLFQVSLNTEQNNFFPHFNGV